jgi:hypothetical protein
MTSRGSCYSSVFTMTRVSSPNEKHKARRARRHSEPKPLLFKIAAELTGCTALRLLHALVRREPHRRWSIIGLASNRKRVFILLKVAALVRRQEQ